MKAHKVHSCKDCFFRFKVEKPEDSCVHPKRKSWLCDMVKIPADCPLPDWPRVSREEIYHACNGMTAVVRDVLAVLRRKGVEVVDEPPDPETDPGTAGDGRDSDKEE